MSMLLRLFFAIELSVDVRKQLTSLMKHLRMQEWERHIRWSQPENLHVTLRFLGNCTEEQMLTLVRQIPEGVKKIPPFTLQLGNVALFPSTKNPRVLAVNVVPCQQLYLLLTAIEEGVVQTGFPPEQRPYLPHITLGYVSRPSLPQRIHLPEHGKLISNLEWEVNKAVLFNSTILAQKRVYVALQNITLGN